jgi:hypothetical protein
MAISQLITFALLMLVIAALVYLFARHGTSIKGDTENKSRSDQGFF